MRVLLIASAVSPIGHGLTGGVSDALYNTINALSQNGHSIDIIASEESSYKGPAKFIKISGNYQPSLQGRPSSASYPIITSSLIANYWHYVNKNQEKYDIVLNFCNDWLPYYLTSFMDIPVLHRANICDFNEIVTEAIQQAAQDFPSHVGVLSRAHAMALDIFGKSFICGHAIDSSLYVFNATPKKNTLICCARISPEKGIEDAAEVAKRSNKTLILCGYIQDQEYFEKLMRQYSNVIDYRGFLGKADLVEAMGNAEALLCTHKCIEAFGLVVIESLACGTPVITYDRGGPAEIIENGKTGFVVEVDNTEDCIRAVEKLPDISREYCRKYCLENFGLAVYGERLEVWFGKALEAYYSPK